MQREHFLRFFAMALLGTVLNASSAVIAQEASGRIADKCRAGVNGVSTPQCWYCPQPKYSEQALKAKYSGDVLLDVTVTAEGNVIDPVMIKSPGLGLDAKAMAEALNWKMKPARGRDGNVTDCRVQILMSFRMP
jgi:TonB family protein